MAEKGTIDEIGRALNYNLNLVSKIKDSYDKNPEATRIKNILTYFIILMEC